MGQTGQTDQVIFLGFILQIYSQPEKVARFMGLLFLVLSVKIGQS